jgi:hypothetical protein
VFRVDQSCRVSIPSALFGEDESIAYYGFTELVGNHPVWLVHVLSMPSPEDGTQWWKRVLVSGIDEALAILSLDAWSARNLYVLLPEYLTGADRLTFGLCHALHECKEPDSEQRCWRIKTDTATVLQSSFGTELGQELGAKLVWSSASIDPGLGQHEVAGGP